MKVDLWQGSGNVYTCNVYLVRGEWNRIEDVNTLIDVGSDPEIFAMIEGVSTGLGKRKIEQVVLTHSHSDHCAMLPLIRGAFQPLVCASSPYLEGVDRVLRHGDRIKVGDRYFEIIHMPGHSGDSISLYNVEEAVLFSGDVPIVIQSFGGSYDSKFANIMEDLCKRPIRTIYPGHGRPLTRNVRSLLEESLLNIRRSFKASP